MTAIVTDGARAILSCSAATRCSPDRAVSQDALAVQPEIGLFLVADGLGGHHDGDLASRAVAEAVRRAAASAADAMQRRHHVEAALRAINRALRREAARLGGGAIVGTTVAVLLVDGAAATGLWVGDSRIYLGRGGRMAQLTRDHSFAADAAPGVRRQMLSRAVGSGDELELEGFIVPIESGDTLLLCSDGVSKVLAAEEIAALLAEPVSGQAERLIARAVLGGGRDDMTAVVVRVEATLAPGQGGEGRA
jgi:protein phosphatase